MNTKISDLDILLPHLIPEVERRYRHARIESHTQSAYRRGVVYYPYICTSLVCLSRESLCGVRRTTPPARGAEDDRTEVYQLPGLEGALPLFFGRGVFFCDLILLDPRCAAPGVS